MSEFHLAQLNIARFVKPQADPVNADFINNLDRVNAIAEASPGFVWRLVGDGNDATDIEFAGADGVADPNTIVNMSVWESLDDLMNFVYKDEAHLSIMRRRKEWFERMSLYQVLWWVPAGHTPTVDEALARLAMLEANGSGAEAFTFAKPFNSVGEPGTSVSQICA